MQNRLAESAMKVCWLIKGPMLHFKTSFTPFSGMYIFLRYLEPSFDMCDMANNEDNPITRRLCFADAALENYTFYNMYVLDF